MPVPLLATKLYIPTLNRQLVPRPRLVARLQAGLDCKLTLLSAPAGFGKTTLLCEWIADCGLPVAWVSLDEGDNDLTRFLAYLIASLRTLDPEIGGNALAMLQSPKASPAEPVLVELVNDITSEPVNESDQRTREEINGGLRQMILVLDDFHSITATSIHEAIAFLLDHMPGNLHLIISGRADPALPLARLRGRGQLVELRQSDLRFRLEEVKEFLNQVMDLSLSEKDIDTLASRTEGWIAGLQMAGLSMQGRQDASAFIQAFSGTNRYILDYLVEEVLGLQSEATQNFLLRSAILERMTGPLCEAVTGQKNGQRILESLERDNLFIVSLDDERRWYRYHQLFADLLYKQLLQVHPELAPELHRRASVWFRANGSLVEAVEHALLAQDHEQAAGMIADEAEAILMRAESGTLLRWLDSLPEEVVHDRPSLCAYQAWALFLDGRPWDEIKSHLVTADCDDLSMSGKAAALHALAAIYQGRLTQAEELSRQALQELSEDDILLRSIASWNLGMVSLSQGQDQKGINALEEVARVSQETGNLMVTVMVLCNLADVWFKRGQLHQAEAIYQRALEHAIDRQGRRLPVAGQALIGLGEIEREWNQLETATQHLSEGIQLVQNWGNIWAIEGYLSLARVQQAMGKFDAAQDSFVKAQKLAEQFDVTELDDKIVALHLARFRVDQKHFDAVIQWVDERRLRQEAVLEEGMEAEIYINYHIRIYERIVLARLMIAQGQYQKAINFLTLVIVAAQEAGRVNLMIEANILRSLAFYAQDWVDDALRAVETALSIAEEGGYIRLFVDEGQPMKELLQRVKTHGATRNYVDVLLKAFDPQPVARILGQEPGGAILQAQPHESQVLVDPLSQRELQVLRYLMTELSTPEIADELVVAVSTVRSHVKSIYSKLGVHSRFQAVEKGRELGLI